MCTCIALVRVLARRGFLIRKDSVITDVSQIQVILQNEICLHYAKLIIVHSHRLRSVSTKQDNGEPRYDVVPATL
jgi:hypothetical protein